MSVLISWNLPGRRRACTRKRACGWAEQCHSVPSPHVGEGQGGGYNTHRICFLSDARQMQTAVVLESAHRLSSGSALCRHPPPCPSPTWGEGTVWRASSHLFAVSGVEPLRERGESRATDRVMLHALAAAAGCAVGALYWK